MPVRPWWGAAALLLFACYRGATNADTTGATTGDRTGNTSAGAQTPQTPSSPDSMTQAAGITLRTDRQSYRASDPVTLTIVNGTASQFFYNPCTRILERDVGGAWTEVREDRMCTMIAHMLEARATRTERTDLGEELSAGRYRIVVGFTEETTGGESRAVHATSAPITVTR